MISPPGAEFSPPTSNPAQLISDRAKAFIALGLVVAAVCVWGPRVAMLFRRPPVPSFMAGPYTAKIEQGWIARDIGRQIAETVAYAKMRTSLGNALKFEGAINYNERDIRMLASINGASEIRTVLKVQDFLWSPDTFAPWAKALISFSHVDLAQKLAKSDPEFPTRLLAPRPEILVQEDVRISEELTKNPLSVESHEQAALLIGSLAMREAASDFQDARPALNAMAAHLAISKALRAELGVCGKLAEAILCSLAGRQAAALQIVDQLQNGGGANALKPETATAWARALKLYNTGDYRLLDQPGQASLLERLEYFRALHDNIDSSAATAFAVKQPLERLSEWSARIMAGTFSVEDGNRWADRALETELDECAREYRSYHGDALAPKDFARVLNMRWETVPKSAPEKIQVLGWGAWAEFHQRQLCELFEQTFCWLNCKLGLPEESETFREEITHRFGTLELFPLVYFENTNEQVEEKRFDEAAGNFSAAHRERITFQRWHRAFQHVLRFSRSSVEFKQLSEAQSWFNPILPAGTAYDVAHRSAEGRLNSRAENEPGGLKQIAPYSIAVLESYLMQSTNFQPTAEQRVAQYNELSGYNVSVMKKVAEVVKNDPVRYQKMFAQVCRLAPNHYIELGNYLVAQGDENGAARAYQSAFDEARDRVYMSNNCVWLVNYYYDHGRKDDAFKIATDAAQVYSSGGLATMGDLLERSGRLDEAESYFRKIQERYNEHSDLDGFFVRNRARSTRYGSEADHAVAKDFPKGLEQVKFNDFTTRPRDGVALTQTSAVTQKLGLNVGDVFVAIDGYRIRNKTQYYFIRDLKRDPKITYIVWKSGQYIELKANVSGRRIGGEIADYSPQ